MTQKREIRMFAGALRVEHRASESEKDNLGTLIGHAAVFNQRTNLGFFDEVIKPGAFRNTLKEGADVRALVDHDPSRIIGRSKDGGKNGTLRLKEDRIGLRMEIDVADTQAGRDIMESVRRGDVDGMSFGFFVREDGDKIVEEKSGRILRELRDLDLFDVSVVSFPAYPQASDLSEQNSEQSFEVRSMLEVYESIPEEVRERAESCEGETPVEDTTPLDASELRKMVKEAVREVLREELSERRQEQAQEEEGEEAQEEASEEVQPDGDSGLDSGSGESGDSDTSDVHDVSGDVDSGRSRRQELEKLRLEQAVALV